MNEPINKPTDQPTTKPTEEPVDEPIDVPTKVESDDHEPAREVPGEEHSTPLPVQSNKGPTNGYDAAVT